VQNERMYSNVRIFGTGFSIEFSEDGRRVSFCADSRSIDKLLVGSKHDTLQILQCNIAEINTLIVQAGSKLCH